MARLGDEPGALCQPILQHMDASRGKVRARTGLRSILKSPSPIKSAYVFISACMWTEQNRAIKFKSASLDSRVMKFSCSAEDLIKSGYKYKYTMVLLEEKIGTFSPQHQQMIYAFKSAVLLPGAANNCCKLAEEQVRSCCLL